ncbi:MAG: peptidylprolyl isomerase [Steroidobacteraceae bacterium]|jgi:cyclophilin family peptidyl-prolyl cis-trans isomerase|nr:peptidylprolyl isomerase [Steroidobacteraceae bacterium]
MKRLIFLLALLPIAGMAASDPLAPRVRVETSAGDFVIQLDTVRAPLTAQNFLRYVRDGFYDGTVFHRVVEGFVVQGGGFDRAYALKPTAGPVPNESGNGLSNRRGWVGLARGDSPHSGTSQFYVNLMDNVGLNPLPTRWGYAVFGQVIEGMEVVDRISLMPTGAVGPFGAEAPLTPVVLRRATVIGEDTAPPAPEPPTEPQAPAVAESEAGAEAPPGEPPTDGAPEPAPQP